MSKPTHYQHTNSKGQTYHLHARTQKLKGGNSVTLHYFGKEANPTAPCPEVPATHEVTENARTGLPMLKKKLLPE